MAKRQYRSTTHVWLSPSEIDRIATKMFGENWRRPFCDFFEISYPQLYRIMSLEPGRGLPKGIAMAMVMIDQHGKPELTRVALSDASPVKRDPSFVSANVMSAPAAELDFDMDSAVESLSEAATEAKEAISKVAPTSAKKPAKQRSVKPSKPLVSKAKKQSKKPAKETA